MLATTATRKARGNESAQRHCPKKACSQRRDRVTVLGEQSAELRHLSVLFDHMNNGGEFGWLLA